MAREMRRIVPDPIYWHITDFSCDPMIYKQKALILGSEKFYAPFAFVML